MPSSLWGPIVPSCSLLTVSSLLTQLNGRQVALPVWPSRGQVIIRPSGNFILLYTNFGLQIRYDGNHLVQVTVPSSYAGRLCGLCGEFPGTLMWHGG